MLSAVIALVGAVVYGSADFFGGLAARRLRSIVVTAISAFAGLVALVIALPVMGGAWSLEDVLWGVLAGGFGIVAIALLYACLAIGPMSILSPLTAVVSAIAPMVWGLTIGGETLPPLGYAGLAVALVAVVLVGFIPGEKVVRPQARGVLMGIGAGLAIGAFLIVMDNTGGDSGIVPLLMSRVTSTVVTTLIVTALVIVAVRRGRAAATVLDAAGAPLGSTPSGRADLEHVETPTLSVQITRVRALWFAVICGVLDAAANALMLVALRLGDLSIVSALTALYPAGTILLAAVVLRERVAPVQWIGLALALVAGGMLGVA
ncbi:DMT family transporter [Microbacterium aoyamense]|uniref:DMT family transporter n=1 Tax=Microbacterium aoyamense TaxID=344166 RepID=A0ABP5BCD9_9MICO|nr:EamA family transporter [Microbacterium aoyamense]